MPNNTAKKEEDFGFVPHDTDQFGFVPDTPTGLSSINEPTTPEDAGPSFLGINKSNLAQTASDIYSPLLKYGGAAAAGAAALPAATAMAAGTGGAAIPLSAAMEVGAGATGYAVGASLSDQLDQLIGLSAKPQSVGEIAGKTGENLKEGLQQHLLGGITGAGIEGAANLTLTGASALATKGPEAIARVSQAAANLGINLTPAELLGTKSLSALETMLDNLPWTSGIIQKYRLGEMDKLKALREKLISENGSGKDIEELGIKIKNMADNFMQKVGTVNKNAMVAMKNRLMEKLGSNSTYDDLDISAKEAVQRYQQDLSQQVSSAYSGIGQKVDQAVGPQGMTPENTLEAANKIIAEQKSVQPGARNNDLLTVAKSLVADANAAPSEVMQVYQSATPQNKALIEQQFPEITNPSISKTYSDLDNNVKAFNIKKYSQVDSNGQMTNAGRQWDTLIDAMHEDMNTMAASTGDPELTKAHEIADQLFKKKLALFEDPAFKLINNKYPGAVSKTILESNNPELINRYKSVVGENLFNKTKDRFTNDVLGLNEGEIVNGDDIRANLLKLGESAKTIYSPDELQHFQNIAKAVDIRSGATNELLKNPLLERMVGKQAEIAPKAIAKAIITPQNAGAATAVETILGKDAKKKIGDAFLPQLLSKNQNGDFMPQTFAKQFNEYGKKTIEAWYGKDLADQLEQIATVGQKMGGAERLAGNPSGTARNLIGFYEGTRLLRKATTAVMSGFEPTAMLSLGEEGAMMLGTRQLAKLYTSPMGRKLFVDGLITPAASKEAGVLSGKILSIIGNEYLKSKENQQ